MSFVFNLHTGSKLHTPQRHILASAFLALSCLIALQVFATNSMSLPDGINGIFGFEPKSSFKCEQDGYFGDVENDCRLFHLCQKQVLSNGRTVSCLF